MKTARDSSFRFSKFEKLRLKFLLLGGTTTALGITLPLRTDLKIAGWPGAGGVDEGKLR